MGRVLGTAWVGVVGGVATTVVLLAKIFSSQFPQTFGRTVGDGGVPDSLMDALGHGVGRSVAAVEALVFFQCWVGGGGVGFCFAAQERGHDQRLMLEAVVGVPSFSTVDTTR